MKILFTGHRNKLANSKALDHLREKHLADIWMHGGAVGFDNQIAKYAEKYGLKTEVHLPEYEKYGKRAPLVRNDEMLALCDLVVALYDGRDRGGTFYTITQARKLKKRVIIIVPYSRADAFLESEI